MPFYTSHTYLEAKPELLSFLKSDPVLSNGLFHLRQSSTDYIHPDYRSKFSENGMVVVREVCDPNFDENDHCEASTHRKLNEPVVSWWELKGPKDTEVIFPIPIPTIGFGRIIINDKYNPPPPVEFLRFLKNLSVLYEIRVAYYTQI